MKVLCIGGIADGEYRELPFPPFHSMTFNVAEESAMSTPMVIGSNVPPEDLTVTTQVYRLHEFNMASTPPVKATPGHTVVKRWIAGPADWSSQELFDNLIAGYAQVHEEIS